METDASDANRKEENESEMIMKKLTEMFSECVVKNFEGKAF